MNCDVVNNPTVPLGSPRKNSMVNLPRLYRIRYHPNVSSGCFPLFRLYIRNRKMHRSPKEEISCVGMTGVPTGHKEFVGKVTPYQAVVALP